MSSGKREGEVLATIDPAQQPGDAHVVFIGRIRSPWHERSDCPKNLRQARERDPQGCRLEIDEAWRPALAGLEAGHWINLLYWMHEARRDILIQHPRHRDEPTGTFSLRSPVRPNPIALSLVRIISLDLANGLVGIDATDALDGTPLLDIKPHLPSIDMPPA